MSADIAIIGMSGVYAGAREPDDLQRTLTAKLDRLQGLGDSAGGLPPVSEAPFLDVTGAAGVDFVHTSGDGYMDNILESIGSGLVLGLVVALNVALALLSPETLLRSDVCAGVGSGDLAAAALNALDNDLHTYRALTPCRGTRGAVFPRHVGSYGIGRAHGRPAAPPATPLERRGASDLHRRTHGRTPSAASLSRGAAPLACAESVQHASGVALCKPAAGDAAFARRPPSQEHDRHSRGPPARSRSRHLEQTPWSNPAFAAARS